MDKKHLLLYLVTDSGGMEENAFLRRVEEALAAGVTLLQLREKEREGRELYLLAQKVNALARRCNVPLLIDDRVDIAMAVDAAGVHVGQSDIPVHAARSLLGPDKIVGATAKTVEQALKAQEEGADYLGVGAIYPTSTKVKTIPTSPKTLTQICRRVDIPAIAIGGLNQHNLEVLRGTGIHGVAVVSAIMKRTDAAAAVAELKAAATDILR